jgi:hypothetical protein
MLGPESTTRMPDRPKRPSVAMHALSAGAVLEMFGTGADRGLDPARVGELRAARAATD